MQKRPHEGQKDKEKTLIKCTIFVKSFFDKSKMNSHIRSGHEGKKPYKCEVWKYSFFRKSSLKIHKTSVHKGNKDKKALLCKICTKEFFQKKEIGKHNCSW